RAQRLGLPLQRAALPQQGRQRGVALGARGQRAAAEREPAREHAVALFAVRHGGAASVAVVLEPGVLGEQVVVALVHALDLALRITICLEQRDAPVLVRVGGITGERRDE